MICNKCGAEVKDDAKFCGSCGEAVNNQEVMAVQKDEKPKKFWQKTWFAWIMLFIFPPVGIGLLWVNNIHGKVARIVISLFFAFVFYNTLTSDKSPSNNVGNNKAVSQNSTSKSTSLDEKRAVATKEITAILNTMPFELDQVTKKTYYRSWGSTNKRSLSNGFKFNWYVVKEKDSVYEYVIFDDFTDNGTDWIWWNKIVFSTADKNVNLRVSSSDKEEKVYYGGKLETYQVQANKVKEALETITSSSNPIIRLEGKGYHRDYRPSQSDLEEMKKALKTQRNIEMVNYHLRN